MTFDDWHDKQLAGDADNCQHEGWERKAWNAAIEAAAKIAEAQMAEYAASMVLAEREACAAICDRYGSSYFAEKIRGRSNASLSGASRRSKI